MTKNLMILQNLIIIKKLTKINLLVLSYSPYFIWIQSLTQIAPYIQGKLDRVTILILYGYSL